MIDQAVSHYLIIKSLGVGGMGEVYLAKDTRLGRQVALKFLKEDYTQDAERLWRFEHEAKSASALNHPNILTIHEFGQADGHHFIATEFVDGESLRALLERRGRLATEQALTAATQLASALSAAHEAGIVHRDIKPENIMLRRDGYVKVLDFGLAKLTQSPAGSEPSAGDRPHTVSGMVVGTTDYMSPEQAAGAKVDKRSDIFSFGAVLYEMLCGRPAFRSETTTKTVAAILTREPDPLPGTTDPELAKVVARCLKKDPDRRFQSVADIRVALEEIQEARAATLVLRARAKRTWMLAALIPALGVAAFVAWRAWQTSAPMAALRAVPLTTLRGVVRYPAFSPDGDRVAFTWNGERRGNPDIYVQQINAGTPLRLTADSANDYNPVWSPDGQWIAFLRSQSEPSRSEVRLVPPLGGSERKISDIHVRGGTLVTPPYLTWCPDSKCLIVTDSPGEGIPDALFRLELDTGEKRQLTFPKTPAVGDMSPTVSPDGRRLVFRRMAGLFVGELYTIPLDANATAAGAEQRLTAARVNAEYPSWLPNNRELVYSARSSLWRLDINGGEPARLPFVGEYGVMPVVSAARPGRPSQLVYVRSFEDGNIWRIDIPEIGGAADSIGAPSITSTRLEDMPQLSPDGRRVAFTSDRTGDWEIWVSDLDGSNAVALTSMKAVASGYPHWSPNGDEIVFHSNLEGQWDVYAISSSGGAARRLTDHPATDDFPSYSRDGKWIYFSSNRTSSHEQTLWKVAVAGGEAVQVTTTPAYAALESPDGASIYYVETLDRPSALRRMPVTGGTAEKVLDGVYLANYAVLQSGIYYLDRASGAAGIHYVDLPSAETSLRYFEFATKRSRTVARGLGSVDLPIAVSADGRTIFYPRIDSGIHDLLLVSNFR
ncbi:MAG: protein kinase [Gemmatimonadota bacterium]